ncbi:MAG: tRNA (adenosine(37)-N6)-dimethylallyltransferase MiaA [Candidatus Dormiibacterota bacterium]
MAVTPAPPLPSQRVLAVMGPTASGKTRLAVALAKELDGELVNADSRQSIAELAVGVCKPSSVELQGIPCHGLGWSQLGVPFSAAAFRERAGAALTGVWDRGRLPVVVGGTGLYIRALLSGFDFGGVAPEAERQISVGTREQEAALAVSAARSLAQLDSERARTVDLRNPRRVIRAAELARAGVRAGRANQGWSVLKFGCRVSPGHLRERIAIRSDQLMAEPLAKEVEGLLQRGFSPILLARSAIGYAEAVDWLTGRRTRQQAVERLISRTWRYARAQMTWLRSEPDLIWVDAEASLEEMLSGCLAVVRKHPAWELA